MLSNHVKVSVLLLSGILVQACSHSESSHSDSTHSLDTVRIGLGATPSNLDPTLIDDMDNARIIDDLFAGLVDYDQANKPVPGLAEKWQISADGKTYTFHLHPNLHFSDGTSLTANDVVNSFYRLADPTMHANYAYLLAGLKNGDAVIHGKLPLDKLGIKATDENTLVIELKQANSQWLDILTLPCFDVVKVASIKEHPKDWTTPEHLVTSGPYQLVSYVVNGEIKLSKNPYYFQADNVQIKNVIFISETNRTSEFNTYRAGGLDMTSSVPMDLTPELKSKYQSEFKRGQYEALVFYDFNNATAPFKDNLKLRQALTIAIDRETLVTKIISDELRNPLYGVITPTIDGGKYKDIHYSWESLPRVEQIKLAQKLYAEAGYSKAHPLKVEVLYNTDEGNKKRTLALASMWQQVLGVEATAHNQEWKTFLQSRHQGAFQISRDGVNPDYNSVEAYAQLYVCHSLQNSSQYCNPAYDKLIAEAHSTTNETKKVVIYHQAFNLVMEDYPILPLYQPTYTRLVKPYLHGYDSQFNYLGRYQSKWFSLVP